MLVPNTEDERRFLLDRAAPGTKVHAFLAAHSVEEMQPYRVYSGLSTAAAVWWRQRLPIPVTDEELVSARAHSNGTHDALLDKLEGMTLAERQAFRDAYSNMYSATAGALRPARPAGRRNASKITLSPPPSSPHSRP